MKSYLPVLISCGVIIVIIFQAVLFTNTALQSQSLQKQLNEVSLKLDKLNSTTDDSALALAKLSEEVNYNNVKLSSTQNVLYPTEQASLLSPANLSQTLGTNIDSTPSGVTLTTIKKIRLTSNWKSTDAFDTTKLGSSIQGQLVSGKDYDVLSKEPGWYRIRLNTTTTAWVQSKFVYETN